MALRLAERSDVDQMVRLHMGYLPSRLSDLGEGIVRFFYKRLMDSPDSGRAYVVVENDRIFGFVVLARSSASIFEETILGGLKNKIHFFLHSKKKYLIRALIDNFFFDSSQIFSTVELVYIVVDPAHQGKAIGAALLKVADLYARELGQNYFELEVDASNDRALAFYKNNNFREINFFNRSGKAIHRLRRYVCEKEDFGD